MKYMKKFWVSKNVFWGDIYSVHLCPVSFLSFSCKEALRVFFNLEDTLEECLFILDDKHQSINKILEIPIFFDSVEVRQVLSDIQDCHNAVVVVANKLTSETGITGDIKEES